ncbi:MAG TPA: PAS domain S-box protein [Blastocatellia bacterium]|nr:PAS domain S-box protein [Blastocatellia bacterium]
MATADKQKVRGGVDNPWQKPVGPGADDTQFLYSPVSFSAVINPAAGPLRRLVLLLWAASILLSIVSGVVTREYNWRGFEFTVSGVGFHLTLFTPLIIGALLTFWFGSVWGFGATMLGAVATLLWHGMSLPSAIVMAAAIALGMMIIPLAYRTTPISVDLRSNRSLVFYLFVSFFAALVSSGGAFVWAYAHRLDASDTLMLWRGSWIRAFLQSVVITWPILWAAGRPVIRWKNRLALNRPWQAPGTNDIGLVFGLMLFIFSLFVIGASYLARLNLKAALAGLRDQALIGMITSAVESLSLIDLVSFGFIIVTGYFGYQLAINWTRTLRERLDQQIQSLRESEERYRMMFEMNPQPMYVFDRETLSFLAVNEAMVKSYGYSRDEFLGMTSRDIRPPEDVPKLVDTVATATGGLNPGGQWQHRKKDGTLITVEVIYSALDFAGRPAILAQAADVSDRKRTEEKIRKLNDYLESSVRERTAQLALANAELRKEVGERRRAEEVLRQTNRTLETLIESSPLAIITFDAEEKVTRWNQAAESLFGWTAQEVIGYVLPIIPPDRMEKDRPLGVAVREGESFTGLELNSQRKDGTAIKVALSVAPLHDESGSFQSYIAIIGDITERKLMEEELRESEERYRALFDSIPLPVWVHDSETLAFLMVNDAAVSHYGFSREEFAAMTIMDLRPRGDRAKLLNTAAESLPKFLRSAGWQHRRKDGTIIDVDVTSHEIVFGGRQARLVVANDITELRRALDALRETNQTLETLVQSSPLAIIMLDPEGRVRVWNTAAERMFGWTEAELAGNELPFVDEYLREDFRAMQEVVMQGVPFSVMDMRSEKRDGSLIDLSVSAAPVSNAVGDISGIMAVITDITERKRAEEKLRESEERFRDLFENASDLIQSVGPDGRLLYVNRAWLETLGYRADEVTGLNMLDIIDPGQQEHCLKALGSVFSGDEVGEIETVFVTRDGRRIMVEGSINCRYENGRPVSTRGIFRDITRRKQAEDELRASEARVRAIVENSLSGLILTDERGFIQLINPAAEMIFGYTREELVGQHLALLVPASVGTDRVRFLKASREKALGRVTEWQGQRKDGEIFPFELSFYEFNTPEGRQFVGNIRDLSERHEVDRLKKEFISTVSHELRTPLTSIRGSLSLLASGTLGEIPSEAGEMLSVASRNTVRLISLINDILDLERLESGKMEMHPVTQPLAPVFERARESVQAFADQQQIRINILPTEITVLADGDRLVQVLVNLLSNAIKFSPGGSEVTVSGVEQDGWVEVRVEDEGRGVPAEFRDKIFERFRQVDASDDRQKGGTGLGLAICRNIVEQHEGRIGVESEEGRGSTFWFRIPAKAASHKSAGSYPSDRRPAGARVLVCSADAAQRDFLTSVLEKENYRAVPVATADEAWAVLERQVVALVILDAPLPGNACRELINKIRADARLSELPVVMTGSRIILSSESFSEQLAVLLPTAAPPEQLISTIREILPDAEACHVLLVDDDESLLDITGRQLERGGLRICTARTGEEAIRHVRRETPGMIILDVGLPDGDGFEVVEALRREPHLKSIPLLVYTGRDLNSQQRGRLQLGPTRFLMKSKSTGEELLGLVRELLDSGDGKKATRTV